MKILFAISLLAIVAAAALAFMTRSSLLDTRSEKDRINKDTVAIHEAVEKVNAETVSVWGAWEKTMKDAKDEDTAKKKLVRETNEQDDVLKDVMKQIEDILSTRAKMEAEIEAIIGRAGTPEEVLAKVEALKGTTDALSAELDTLKKDLEHAKKAAKDSDEVSGRFKTQQTARLKAIRLAARSATVAAVNQEFSFVVVNMGRNDGLTMDARLLVKRGGQMIGRLNIVSIEAGQTVADIDLKSVRRGMQIVPGDQVVIENSVQ